MAIPEDRKLNEAQQVQLWALDRVNLANCGDLHSQTVEWVKARDKDLTDR